MERFLVSSSGRTLDFDSRGCGSNPRTRTKLIERNFMNYVCYVFVRHLPHTLNAGKLAAQVHHAGTQLVWFVENNSKMSSYLNSKGFGTTIVLEAENKENTQEQIERIVNKANIAGFNCGLIIDPSYPVDFELTCECLTCGYILLDKDAEDEYTKGILNDIQTNWRLYK